MANATLFAQAFGDRWHHGGHPWLGLLFMALFGTAIALLVFALVRTARPTHHYAPAVAAPADPAMETLRIRFARGEIDAAEYAARAAHLSGAVPPPAPPATPPSAPSGA